MKGKRTGRPELESPFRWSNIALFWICALTLGMFIPRMIIPEIPYSEFLEKLKSKEISEVVVKDHEIYGKYVKSDPKVEFNFKTIPVEPKLLEQLKVADVKIKAEASNSFWTGLLGFFVPFLLVFLIIRMIMMKDINSGTGSGGFLSVGKSHARVYMEEEIQVTFKDVAGVEEAKDELKEIVTFLKEPDRYQKLGGKLPKGILLVGPPGTGKTLLARAVAGEANVPFFSISGSEFVELFVGVGAARVRDLFDKAKRNAPCIIFIDELDALGRARGAGPVTGGHDEKEQTLNQLLAELDGFDSNEGVVLISATNRPEILDPALLRAGRFDRQVLVDRPDKTGRLQILKIHAAGVKLNESVGLHDIAAMTPGFTGADLANLVNEATLLAARRNADSVEIDDFNNAIERIVAGLEKKNRLLNEKERSVVAFHEMGHALVSLSLPGTEPVQKVSIIPRGIGALGYTLQRPTEDRFLMSKEELENKMTTLLGGRAAEKLVFGEISTGAADDFVKATSIARNMVTRYGMVESLGMVAYEQEDTPFLAQDGHTHMYRKGDFSPETAREIDCAVRKLINEAFEKAISILEEQRETLDKCAQELLAKETLQEDELRVLLGRLAPEPTLSIGDV